MSDTKEELYAEFSERGYDFKAFISDEGPPHFVIRVTDAATGEQVREEKLGPLMYGAVFGVDVSDIAALEEKTEEILKELPELPRQ
jgi:hypothetical protein